MNKLLEFFKELNEWVGQRGWLHLLAYALLALVLCWIRPFWLGMALVAVIGFAKNAVLCIFAPEHTPTAHEAVCEIIGAVAGILLSLLYLIN